MKNYNLKDIVNGQEKAKQSSFNTDLFAGDREPLEQFDKSAYSDMFLMSVDNTHDKGEHDKLLESVIVVGHESDFYMVTATTTSYNSEVQRTYTQQAITLAGFNFFTKEIKEDFTDIYNNYLQSKGYEITVDDVKELGELHSEFNGATILSFTDDEDNKHYITVNQKNQLSKITVKLSDKEVKTKSTIESAFA